MEYVNLGRTGVKVSRICLGCMSYGVPPAGQLRPGSNAWSLNEEQSEPFFRQALDAGINFLRYGECVFDWRQRARAGKAS
jgi:aryl-alcohol dehydrogenase-like predicted oxidoreductase